jgi:hypothetical protein
VQRSEKKKFDKKKAEEKISLQSPFKEIDKNNKKKQQTRIKKNMSLLCMCSM